ncbi:MAG: energy transducer TonB, partial [Myxococcales bacterium]|nr:energy transducer TonB [Myxococcales bacterium]
MTQAPRRFWIFLTLGLWAWSAPAGAQDLVAPRVRSLPGVQVPAGIEVPESGVVRVRVRIDTGGGAVVEKCDGGRSLCDLVIEAIGKAEFDPATRDGNPVPSQVRVDLRLRPRAVDEESDAAPEESVLEPARAQ